MPIKPLSFKGEKKHKSKKRKIDHISSSTNPYLDRNNNNNDDDDESYNGNQHETETRGEEESPTWITPSSPSHLSGPVVILLPTTPPTFLASDPNGTVFASLVENMIDGDRRTAEPSDVRQVWVCAGIPGSENSKKKSYVEQDQRHGDEAEKDKRERKQRVLGFKGSHGGWLGCDDRGVLGAMREARGQEEAFTIIVDDDDGESGDGHGIWRLKTASSGTKQGEEKYISVKVDGDGNENDTGTRKNLKISIRGNGTIPTKIKSEIKEEEDDSKNHDKKIKAEEDGEEDDKSTRITIRMQHKHLPPSLHNIQNTTNNNSMSISGGGNSNSNREKTTRQELEQIVGRKQPLTTEEIKRLKKAKKDGDFYETVLDVRMKGKSDKFA